MSMQLGAKGRELIQSFEQLAYSAYRKFPTEPWTCGWGHTKGVTPQTTCDDAQAAAWFDEDTHEAVLAVLQTVDVALNQNEFDALVSFTYNVGAGSEAHSTLVKLLNNGHRNAAADELLKWDHVNGVESPGLKRRREAERELFLQPV